MAKALKRSFKRGESVYIVDYWGTKNGSQAFETIADVFNVDKENETFDAVLYGDTYQTYSFKDYGRLVFDTEDEATAAADRLPKPKTTVFQVIGKRVYKKMVEGVTGQYTDGTYDLIVCLNKGKAVSTKELGRSLFINESEARQSI